MTSRGPFQAEVFYGAINLSSRYQSQKQQVKECWERQVCASFLVVVFFLLAHIRVIAQINNTVIILPKC